MYYVVLTESNHYGYIAFFTNYTEAKKLLKVESEIYYIFKYDLKKEMQFNMKLKYPFSEYYECLSINKYKNEIFERDDDYVNITKNNDPEDNFLLVTHKL